MFIHGNKLFSLKQVGFKPFICDTVYVIIFKLLFCSTVSKAYCKSTQIQEFNQPSQMLYNIIFLSESNFPIRSRQLFYCMFSLTFKAFEMFMTFLLFQSNLNVVLAHGKGLRNSIIQIFSRQKNPKQKTPRPPAAFCAPQGAWIGLQPDLPKYLRIVISKFLVNTLKYYNQYFLYLSFY